MILETDLHRILWVPAVCLPKTDGLRNQAVAGRAIALIGKGYTAASETIARSAELGIVDIQGAQRPNGYYR